MQEIITLIQTVGFPITVALFLLFRYDKRLGDMATILTEISKTLSLIKDAVDRVDDKVGDS